jgi:hypothetical protein
MRVFTRVFDALWAGTRKSITTTGHMDCGVRAITRMNPLMARPGNDD